MAELIRHDREWRDAIGRNPENVLYMLAEAVLLYSKQEKK